MTVDLACGKAALKMANDCVVMMGPLAINGNDVNVVCIFFRINHCVCLATRLVKSISCCRISL
jgi:hypothetical protein